MVKTTVGFKVGIATSLLHLSYALHICKIVSESSSSTAGIAFIPFLILDAPINFLLFFTGGLEDFFSPLIRFGVLGSILWFLIPWLTGRFVERKHADWSGWTKCSSIVGTLFLFVIAFSAIIPLQQFLENRARRPAEVKKTLGKAGRDYLVQRVVFSEKAFDEITYIGPGLRGANAGPHVLVTFNRGMVFLDEHYEEWDRVAFTNSFISVRPVSGMDADPLRLLAFRHFKSAVLLDSSGHEIWRHSDRAEGESPIDGAYSGDVDGDGRAEFAVKRRYRQGLKLLDENGNVLWKHPVDSLGHVEMTDVRGNGKEELFFRDGNRKRYVTLDAEGGIVSRFSVSGATDEFALVRWPGIRNRLNMLLPGENRIRLVDLRGRVLAVLDAPGCRSRGRMDAVAVRFRDDGPAYLGVSKGLSPDIAVLYVYDGNGALVYQKSGLRRRGSYAPALAVTSQEGASGERLLVGEWKRFKGAQLVEYSLNAATESALEGRHVVDASDDGLIAADRSHVVHAEGASRLELLPANALFEGRIQLEDKPNGQCLGYWNTPDDVIWFDVAGLAAGTYKVVLNYAADVGQGGELSVQLNERTIEQGFEATGGWTARAEQRLGSFEHDGGPLAVTLSIKDRNNTNYVMNFYSMTLEKE